MKTIIALTGLSGAGKSTLARNISDLTGMPIHSFSTLLKEQNPKRNDQSIEEWKKQLSDVANYTNINNPTLYINHLINAIDKANTSCLIDDLRTPLQLRKLRFAFTGYRIVVVKVEVMPGHVRSFMDAFDLSKHIDLTITTQDTNEAIEQIVTQLFDWKGESI